jgi:hypothetical protein
MYSVLTEMVEEKWQNFNKVAMPGRQFQHQLSGNQFTFSGVIFMSLGASWRSVLLMNVYQANELKPHSRRILKEINF